METSQLISAMAAKEAPKGAGDFPRVMALKTFCHRYNISRTSVYREIKLGRLRVLKMGKSVRIHEEDAEAWVNALRAVSRAPAGDND